MAQLNVICRVPGSYYGFSTELARHIQNNELTALVIVPVNRAVRRLKRQLIQQAGNQALTDPPVFTFDRLLLHLYQHSSQPKRLIPSDTLLVLLQEILESQSNEFRYLIGEQGLNSGLVKRLWETINELRDFGFDAQELARQAANFNNEHPEKIDDFVLLLQKIDEQLGSDFIDEPFARALAAQNLTHEQWKHLFPSVNAVYISGYGLFSPPMLEFLKRVSQWVPVHVQLDYLPANPVLFRHTAQALNKFKTLKATITYKSTNSFLARYLFNRQTSPHKKDLQNRLHQVVLNNRQQEVAFIAGKIRQLHAQGVPLHRIAVTFSHLEKYVPLIRRVFKDFGLPFNLSTGFELTQSPLIGAFLMVLKLMDESFPAEATLGFLQNQFLNLEKPLNFTLLQRLIFKARLHSLSFSNLERLKEQIPHFLNDEEEELQDIEEWQTQVSLLQQVLQPFYDFPTEAPAEVFRKKYLDLCAQLGLLNWYQTDHAHLSERQKEHNFRAYNRFVKVFERSLWTFSQLYGKRPLTRKQLSEGLQRAVLSATYNLTEWPDYGVQIMPRLEILAVDFEVLFLGGLVDGDFPRASVKDIFFNDHLRSELGLVASEELLDQDRFLFYQLLDSPAKQVYLTCPQFQDEEALVPSSFLADLNDLVHLHHLSVAEDDPLFENEPKLWIDWGLNIQFLNEASFRQQAQEKLQLLQTLQPQNALILQRLIDQIRISNGRLMGYHFSEFEGNLAQFDTALQKLKDKFEKTVWSVSRLETYARCPMKFFLRYVLKLEPPPHPEDELSPQERGQLLHEILYTFFRELQTLEQHHEPWRFKGLLLTIARKAFSQMPYQGLFWEMEQLRFLGNEQLKGILPAFLEEEERRRQTMPFVPQNFELAFGYRGTSPTDPQSIKWPVTLKNAQRSFRLQGRIDRIDIDEQNNAVIIDYKSGNVGSGLIQEIKDGLHLQIPLYLAALPHILKDLRPVYGGLYSLKSADKVKLTPALAVRECSTLPRSTARAYLPNRHITDEADDHPLTFDEMIERAVNFALHYIERIQQGHFHHTLQPSQPQCQTYCEFRRLCQKVPGKLERIAAQLKASQTDHSPDKKQK